MSLVYIGPGPPSSESYTPGTWKDALARIDAKDRRVILSTVQSENEYALRDILHSMEMTMKMMLEADKERTPKSRSTAVSKTAARSNVEVIVTSIQIVKEMADIQIGKSSEDALPWACILVLLNQSLEMANSTSNILPESLATISGIIARSYLREGIFQESLVTLYAAILEYLAACLRYSSSSTLGRITTEFMKLSDFSQNLERIQRAEKKIDEEAQLLQVAEYRAPERLHELKIPFERSLDRAKYQLEILRDTQQKNQRIEISNWLSRVPYAAHHESIKSRVLKGSGNWLFERKEFLDWSDSNAASLLWLHGIPGSGKSVLISTIVDHLQTQTQLEPGSIAYFFCSRNAAEPERSDPSEILSCIIRQLSGSTQGLPIRAPVLEWYDRKKRRAEGREPEKLNFDECVELIITLLQDKFAFIALDALDECNPDQRYMLLEALDAIISKSSTPVKIVVSSRDDQDIVFRLQSCPNLYISEKENFADIGDFIGHEIKRVIQNGRLLNGRVPSSLEAEIVESVSRRAHGMFRWASLQIESLCRVKTIHGVEEALNRLPRSLHHSYDIMLYQEIKTLPPTSLAIAERTIKWLIGSSRRLTCRELICAVSIEKVSLEDGSFRGRTAELSCEDIVGLLANLVVLDQEQDTFRFAHFSVLEYLERIDEFSHKECQVVILERCLQTYTVEPLAFSGDLRVYASCYVLKHLAAVASYELTKTGGSLIPVLEAFLLHPSANYLAWINDLERYSEEASEALGLTPLEVCSRIEASHSDPQSPVFIICLFGFLDVLVQILGLDALASYGFSWNMTNKQGVTPLAVTLASNNIVTGKILLSLGADVNARDEKDVTKGTLLHTAVANGDLTALDFLLSNKADIEAKNLDDQTPLNLAAGQENSEIAKSLLEAGALVDAKDLDGLTPLLISVRTGNVSAAALLLENNADCEASDPRRGRTALHWAAVNGNTAAIRLLLSRKCKIDPRDHQESTPVILCFEHEHNDAAKVLLSAGADPKTANSDDVTPLQAALKVENAPCIADYVSAPELSPPGFLSPGAQAKVQILRSSKLATSEKDSVLLKKSFNLLDAHSRIVEFLTRERYLLWKLRHPHIVEFRHYETDSNGTRGNLYMECCTGGDLSRFLDPEDPQYPRFQGKPLPAPTNQLDWIDTWKILSDISGALAYCHYGMLEEEDGTVSLMLQWQSVLHRDIKAANIVHFRDKLGYIVAKLCDLGFAKFFDETQSVSSTPIVRPPELSEPPHHWTTKGDIYCLGFTIMLLEKARPDATKHNIEALRPGYDAINALMRECKERVPQSRPSCLKILRESRKCLSEALQQSSSDSKRGCNKHLWLDFPLVVMIKYLGMLFHSLRYSFPKARPNWIVRLILYWEDFGHEIEWSETEKGLLVIVLTRAFAKIQREEEEKQKEKDQKRIERGYDPKPHKPFRKLVQPKVNASLQGCRWNSYELSLLVLQDLVTLAISEMGVDV